MYLAGERVVVVLSPDDASKLFKDENSLTFDSFIKVIYKGVANVSEAGNKVLWRTPKEGFISLHPNPKEKVLVHIGNALLHKQLMDPEYLQELTEIALGSIEQLMRWDSFFDSSVISSNADTKILSLHCWCRDTLIDSLSSAFFGEALREVDPRMRLTFDEWDMHSWMVLFHYPPFMAQAALKPRDELIRTFTRYRELPPERRLGGVPFVNELFDEERNAGLSVEDSARILLIILWGINVNAHKVAFWMMTHILQQPAFLAAVREEIAPAMEEAHRSSNLYGEILTRIVKEKLAADSCPLLNSAYNEVLRVSSTGCVVRETTSPVRIGDKTVPKHTKIFIPARPLLMATAGFGPDAREVDLARFSKNKALERNPYYRPFGGGITLCSGRVLGRREALTFVALAIWRYDIEVVTSGETVLGVRGMPIPRLDEGKPSLGIAKQVEGDDLIVRITRRER
ncbi:MAG: hypothetical protein Q9195_009382 [Heterodermia aff. obscurata]